MPGRSFGFHLPGVHSDRTMFGVVAQEPRPIRAFAAPRSGRAVRDCPAGKAPAVAQLRRPRVDAARVVVPWRVVWYAMKIRGPPAGDLDHAKLRHGAASTGHAGAPRGRVRSR